MVWIILTAIVLLIIFAIVKTSGRKNEYKDANKENETIDDYMSHGTRKNIEDPKKL